MDNAELYSVYNSMQRQDTVQVLKEFGPRLCWSRGSGSGSDSERVLDVGCGPGNVSAEVLLPRLPPSSSLVGIDISSKMVEFANQKYSNSRLVFKALDFSTKNITEVYQEKSFAKIFSFYCLHWIKNQQQVARNIYSLLQPGGEFLILVSPNNKIFMIYKLLSQMEKWKNYMMDLDDFIPCFYNSTNPCGEIKNVLSTEGLEVLTCEEREHTVTFPSMKALLRSSEAINPFVRRMNQDTREQYMAAYEQIIEDQQLFTETMSGEVLIQNKYIVIHGRRPRPLSDFLIDE